MDKKSNGLTQRVLLGAILAAGFSPIWALFGAWAADCWQQLEGSYQRSENLIFTPDGVPLVLTYVSRTEGYECKDLDGRPQPRPEDYTHGDPLAANTRVPAWMGAAPWDMRINSFSDGSGHGVYWYFIWDGHHPGTGYFVGYDSKSYALVGYLGTKGFRNEPLPKEELIPFDGTYLFSLQGVDRYWHPRTGPYRLSAQMGSLAPYDVYVLSADSKILRVDLPRRQTSLAFETPGLRSLAIVRESNRFTGKTPSSFAARTDSVVLLLDENCRVLARFPIPDALKDKTVIIGHASLGEILMLEKDEAYDSRQRTWRLYWVKPDGTFRDKAVTVNENTTPGMWAMGLVSPSPVVCTGCAFAVLPLVALRHGQADAFGEALESSIKKCLPWFAVAGVISLVFAILCYRRQVRYGASKSERVVWTIFVLLLGLPGWIGYRFGRSWPVLEACEQCGAPAPRDRERCFRCESEFPAPALKGTEVFA